MEKLEKLELDRDILPLRDRMFRYAQSLLLCAEEAEDVVHDLLEHFWRDRDRLTVRRDAASFVMTSVRNRCFDRLRQREAVRRRRETVATTAERATTHDADAWEARELVRRAMARLPERQREALHLKDIEGFPTREVAGILGCDEAQVRVLLSRARCGLREILKKMIDHEKGTERTDR
ncbi:RNA polymerase sigma factor [uncultured Alistipes sp.]|uniref:RNA polymerase sigma factor n=1 Tax=uncultured Alistipes sp. TaxID=538949 RepID=UPI0026237EB2|nr:RNA polymerase sigma factor [uncultured Alistipes sp.]